MFIKQGIHHFLDHQEELRTVGARVGKNNHVPKLFVMLDAIFCSFVFGTIYTEYEALDFFHRSYSNRKTYVTVIWLLRVLRKYNPYSARAVFHDKKQFNETFAEFVKRETLNLDQADDAEIQKFLEDKEEIVLKKSDGCSGKQVCVRRVNSAAVAEDVRYIRSSDYDMIESYVTNCEEIKALNPTSLNTLRIVTVHSENGFRVVCACLRIGAVGSDVDNVSRGGASASIDVETGKITSVFCCNAYREVEGTQKGRDERGLQIPFWECTLDTLRKASRLVPDIHIVGWDVAITPNGPVIIEGNESFHTDVMQFYYGPKEPGIKAKFLDCLAALDEDLFRKAV